MVKNSSSQRDVSFLTNESSVLVAGGAGFIGSHMVDELLKKNCRVTVIDNLSSGQKEWVPSGVSSHFIDLNKTDQILDILLKYQPKIIYHFAGHTRIREALINPQQDAADNLGSTISLIQACIRLQSQTGYKPQQIVFSSTSAVYGSLDTPPFTEVSPAAPSSPYGIAKLAAENYLQWFGELSGVTTTFLRYANVYGPRQSHSGEAGVIAKFMDQLVHKKELCVYGDGKHTRDYIFVTDVVAANIAVSEYHCQGRYVVGTGTPTSTNALAKICQKIVGAKEAVGHVELTLPEQSQSWLDSTALRKKTGWTPMISLEKGLLSTWEWYREHA